MPKNSGFTLVELSIVLVVIGLIVGGILTGQSLIEAAGVRAQISQIENYRTAVNTFRGRFGYLPGDMPDPYASQFGFQTRGTLRGQGDSNGLLEGNCSGNVYGWFQGCGENAVFWEDLSTAELIHSSIVGFEVNGINYPYMLGFNTGPSLTSNPSIREWLPEAKIRDSNFVYTYSVDGYNYFAVSSVTRIGHSLESTEDPGIGVREAEIIDEKMDDGFPQTGRITACYVNNNVSSSAIWSAGGGMEGEGENHCGPTTDAVAYLSTNCFDNDGVAGSVQRYSTARNGNAHNCALSFKF